MNKQSQLLFEAPLNLEASHPKLWMPGDIAHVQESSLSCSNLQSVTIGDWQQYGITISPAQAFTINKLADLIVSSFAQSVCSPFGQVTIVGHADKDWQGPKKEMEVSFRRAMAVQQALTIAVRKLWDHRKMGSPPQGGVKWQTQGKGAKEMTARPYNAANRRVVVTLLRSGSPVSPTQRQNDTIEKRVERLLGLLQTRQVIPDSTGMRTKRAKCLLPKLLNPAVIDVFVDGGVANETINGMTPKFYESIIPGRNVGWLGNYDGTKKPMPNSEFIKFLGTIRPILRGSGFAPTQSDDYVLQILGQMIWRIDDGITMVDAYIARMSMMSDPIIKKLLKIDGFAGDVARKKLQKLYRDGLNDENNIYSCYR
jgi:hypothetical protein